MEQGRAWIGIQNPQNGAYRKVAPPPPFPQRIIFRNKILNFKKHIVTKVNITSKAETDL